MKIAWTTEQINDIIEKYVELGQSVVSLAEEYHVSRSAINTVLKKNNITTRNIKQANGTKIILTEDEVNEILYNYTVLHQGLQTCGKKFGYSQFLVEKLLKERGIKKRNYTESKQISRIYGIDDDYFKTQSENMAYILGFLAADGNVSKKENSVSIQLHIQDIELLKQISNELKNERPIDHYITKNGRDTCKLQFWSAEIKKDLAIYNIVPNKTFTLQPPLFLKQDFIPDFLRGYFDGDGSIYNRNKGNGKAVSISGASQKMMDWIRDQFNNYGITTPSYYTEILDNGTKMHVLRFWNEQSINKIFNLFYSTSSTLYLSRKKDKFSPRDFTT